MSRVVFAKSEHFFKNFEKGQGRPPNPPPSSYTSDCVECIWFSYEML